MLRWLNQALRGIREQIAAVRIEEFFPLDDFVTQLHEEGAESPPHEPAESLREHTDRIASGYASEIAARWDDLPPLPGLDDGDLMNEDA